MLDEAALAKLGIDAGEGMAYCADDPEFYEEMLGEYVREGDERLAELEKFFEGGDWPNYAIRAHSAKNTSRMIGARALSERARELELAAKAGDAEQVAAAHGAFLADYAALIGGIRTLC